MEYIHNTSKHYFAAGNSFFGFKSYFDHIFGTENNNRLYILKGGPGCGKSTFMKKVGLFCEKEGYTVEYYRCSSDPDSLDGIAIKELRTAIADGTSPHAIEPKFAGAFEEIIDLGKSWDTEKLSKNLMQIKDLSERKSLLYKKAYNFLNVCRKINSLSSEICSKHILTEKLEKSTDRLIKGILGKKALSNNENIGIKELRIIDSFSGKGKIHLCTLENMAKICIFIKAPDFLSGSVDIFMNTLVRKLSDLNANMIVCPGIPDTSTTGGIYLIDEGISITPYSNELVELCDKNCKKCRIINTLRFMNTEKVSKKRSELKFYTKLYGAFEEKATNALYEASKIHSELEKLYGECTDYSVTEKITKELLKKIKDYRKTHQ